MGDITTPPQSTQDGRIDANVILAFAMAKPTQKIPQQDYKAELVAAVQDIANSLKPRKIIANAALNRASDIRAIGNAIVIGLVVEQAFKSTFDVKKAGAGLVFLAITWIVSGFVERGGVE